MQAITSKKHINRMRDFQDMPTKPITEGYCKPNIRQHTETTAESTFHEK